MYLRKDDYNIRFLNFAVFLFPFCFLSCFLFFFLVFSFFRFLHEPDTEKRMRLPIVIFPNCVSADLTHISEVYCSKAHLASTLHSFRYFWPSALPPQNPDVAFISHGVLLHSLFKANVFCFCTPLDVACIPQLSIYHPIHVLQLVNVLFCACIFRQMSANSRGVTMRY